MALEPQAAIEEAIRDELRNLLGLRPDQCERTFDARPHPSAGTLFVAVWGDGRRKVRSSLPAIDEELAVNVTITLRTRYPYDRRVKDRDELERMGNAIRATVQRDVDYRITNKANEKAGYGNELTQHVGFCGNLALEDFGSFDDRDGRWFQAEPADGSAVSLTLRFGGVRHVQNVWNAT